jgi:probable rRNA maturation factor
VPITFYTEETTFILKKKQLHKKWIKDWIETQKVVCGSISYLFTSNKQIKLINKEYLNHNYFTDVITFDYTEDDVISGDIIISIDEVRINAKRYNTEEEEELRRVMIHGVNHLMGYKDSTDEERDIMRKMENEALHLWLKG